MKIKRSASVVWNGGLKDGRGSITTESNALSAYPYGFSSRFEGVKGTNPEELVAAAHSSCFTMALSMILGEAGFTADEMKTSAVVVLEQVDGGFSVTSSALTLEAKIPNIDEATFQELAGKAKAGCPISKLLKTEISLNAKLAS